MDKAYAVGIPALVYAGYQPGSTTVPGSSDKFPFRDKTKDGYSYVYNTRAISALDAYIKDVMNATDRVIDNKGAKLQDDYRIVNSECLAYGLLNSVQRGEKEVFDELAKTVMHLSQMNYVETRTIKLLPWAAIVNNGGFVIPYKEPDGQFGHASAADADLDLLTALVMGIQKGWGDKNLRSFVHLYATDFIDHVVRDYPFHKNGKSGHFYVMGAGGFIRDKVEGGLNYTLFYPAYPNFSFLEYVADYFSNDSFSNLEGSVYLQQQFRKVADDSRVLMEQLRNEYSDPACFPANVPVAVDSNGVIHINRAAASADEGNRSNFRMTWRTQGAYPITLTAKDDQNCTYYSYLNEVSRVKDPSAAAPIQKRFNFQDINPSESWFTRPSSHMNSHWGGWFQHSTYDKRYDLPDYEPEHDSSFYPSEKEAYYSAEVRGLASKENAYPKRIDFGLDLFKGPSFVNKGDQVFKDTLFNYAQCNTVKSSVIRVNGLIKLPYLPKLLTGNDVEFVSEYLENLQAMKGVGEGELVRQLNRIIAITPDKDNGDNAVLKACYTEMILRWESLSSQEQEYVKTVALRFGLSGLVTMMNNRASSLKEKFQYRPVKYETGATKIDTDTMSVQELNNLQGVSSTLRKMAIDERIRKDLKQIFALPDKERFEAAKKYRDEVPSDYSDRLLLSMIFSEKFNISDRLTLIRTELESLDTSKKEGWDKYVKLLQAYQIVVFKRLMGWAMRVDGKRAGAEDKKRIAAYEKMFFTACKLLCGDIGNVSREEPTAQAFVQKFNSSSYNKFKRYSQNYEEVSANNANLSFWVSYYYGMIDNKKNDGDFRYIADKYYNLSQDIVDTYKKEKAMLKRDWQNNSLFYSVAIRLDLAEQQVKKGTIVGAGGLRGEVTATLDSKNVRKIFNDIQAKETDSRIYGRYEEYANLLATEVFLMNAFPEVFQEKVSIVKTIREDEVFDIRGLDGNLYYGYIRRSLN